MNRNLRLVTSDQSDGEDAQPEAALAGWLRRRSFGQMLSGDMSRYESRWGVMSVPRLLQPGVAWGCYFTAIVDPSLSESDRARLRRPLKAAPHSVATAPPAAFAAILAGFAALLIAPTVGVPYPWNLAFFAGAAGAVLLLVMLVMRRVARVPEDLRDRVITSTRRPLITRHSRGFFKGSALQMSHGQDAVMDAALRLGTVENTTGTTDDETDDAWAQEWDFLRHSRQ